MKVVCIDNRKTFAEENLIVGNIYDVIDFDTNFNDHRKRYLVYINGVNIYFYKERFMNLKEYRKRKLEKLNKS